MWPFTKPKEYRTGGVPDPITPGVAASEDVAGGDDSSRPSRFSLRDLKKCPPLGRQMNWDCVGWAGSYLHEFLEQEETGQTVDLSGQFVYVLAKRNDGYPGRGTFISNAVDMPNKYGVALESDYPEVINEADPAGFPSITSEAMARALRYKNKLAVMINRGDQATFEGLKQSLWKWKRPIIVGAPFYRGVRPGKDGVLPASPKGQNDGHCVAIVGYDDKIGCEFANWWGQDWGDNGFGWFPHGYPINATAWTAVDEPDNWQHPQPPPTPVHNHVAEQRNAALLQAAI